MNDLVETLNYEDYTIRRQMYEDEYYYSICDILRIIYDTDEPYEVWKSLKKKLELHGYSTIYSETIKLKFDEDNIDCVNRLTLLRIISMIDSPRVVLFKNWLASLANAKIEEINDPELAIRRARNRYLEMGYSSEWIDSRIKTAGTRNKAIVEWGKRGASSDEDVYALTDNIVRETFDLNIKEYKDLKGIEEGSLRDNMTVMEMLLSALGEQTAVELHKKHNSQGMEQLSQDTIKAGQTAKLARKQVEQVLEAPVVTSQNALDFTHRKELTDESNSTC